MTIAQLPAFLVPVFAETGQSHLGRYLAEILRGSGGNGLDSNLVSPVMEGVLSISAMYPFDTMELVQFCRDENKLGGCSILESVIMLTEPGWVGSKLRQWPKDPSKFNRDLYIKNNQDIPFGLDTEWVAAALTAAGCNPWVMVSGSNHGVNKPLPPEVKMAIIHDMGGLIGRFLDCPGAPSAQYIADAYLGDDVTWSTISRNERSNYVLEVLLSRGVRLPDTSRAISVLSQATPNAIKLLAMHDEAIPSAPRNKIEAAWKKRSVAGHLDPNDIETMQMAIWGSVNTHMSQHSLDIAGMLGALGAEWGKFTSGPDSYADGFMAGTGKRLRERSEVKRGPMAGQWSLFAAAVSNRLRRNYGHGALTWSVPVMLEDRLDKKTNIWINADCSVAPHRGFLASAIGFDWRPGISINGVVALVLFGQERRYSYNQDAQERKIIECITSFGQAAGIADPLSWACENAQAAADFTCVVLKSPKINASRCFLTTWNIALERNPGMAANIRLETRVEILTAITAHFRLSQMRGQESINFEQVAMALFPGVSSKSFQHDRTLSGHDLRAALVLYLARVVVVNSNLNPSLEIIEGRIGELDKSDLDKVRSWIQALAYAKELTAAALARIDQWGLHMDTALVVPITKTKGLRL